MKWTQILKHKKDHLGPLTKKYVALLLLQHLNVDGRTMVEWDKLVTSF